MRYLSLLLLCWLFYCPTSLTSQVIESTHSFFKTNQINDWLIKDNQLLVATNQGIFVFDENAEVLIDHWSVTTSNLPSNRVESMAINPQTQGLYIGTYDIGAALQTPAGDWLTMPYPEEMVNAFNPMLTYTLAFDQENRLLLGTNQGLWRLTDGSNWENFGPNYFSGWMHSVWDILSTPTGEVYIGGNVIARGVGDDFEIMSPIDSNQQTDLFAYGDVDLHLQSDGALWAFTDIGAAGKYQEGEWELFIPFMEEPVVPLFAMGFAFEDAAGEFWKYTQNNDFFRYTTDGWEASEEAPFGFNNPKLLFELDGQWLGFRTDTLFAISEAEIMPKHKLSDWPWENDNLFHFQHDRQGNLWAKTSPFKLNNLTTGEILDLSFLGVQNWFSHYYFGEEGTMWLVGPQNSVFYLENETLVATYDATNTPFDPDSYIRDFTLSENGTPWLLDGEQRVLTFQNEAWQVVETFPEASSVFNLEPGLDSNCFLSRLANGQIDILEISVMGLDFIELPTNWTNSYFTAFPGENLGHFWTFNVVTSELGEWDGETWAVMSFPSQWDAEDRPLSFREESGRLWMAGEYQMAFYDGTQWLYYNEDDRLWDTSRIFASGMDRDGNIWLSHYLQSVVTRLTTTWGVTDLPTLNTIPVTDKLHLWPNPAATTVRGDWQPGDRLRIFNPQGQLIQSISIQSDQQEVNVGELPAGSYQVELRHQDQTEQNAVLLKLE